MMNEMNHWWGMGWGVGWIIGLLVLAVIIWLIAKAAYQRKSPEQPDKTPLEILNERYARGEISKVEYVEKKKAIS